MGADVFFRPGDDGLRGFESCRGYPDLLFSGGDTVCRIAARQANEMGHADCDSGGLFSTISGMYWSFRGDIPTNQAISVIACFCFAGAVAIRLGRQLARKINIRQK